MDWLGCNSEWMELVWFLKYINNEMVWCGFGLVSKPLAGCTTMAVPVQTGAMYKLTSEIEHKNRDYIYTVLNCNGKHQKS